MGCIPNQRKEDSDETRTGPDATQAASRPGALSEFLFPDYSDFLVRVKLKV